MSPGILGPWLLMALTATLAVGTIAAGGKVRIGEPSALDRQYMTQQRESMRDLARTGLGRNFTGERNNDLRVLQQLLDRRLVRPDQTRELQAMGVILGDLLAASLDMHWVIYEDAIGRTRALRYKKSDEYLFPITMIARRQEVGNQTSVAAIYRKAHDIITPLKPALPFQ